MKRPKNTIKSVFILICLFSLILGGVFVGFGKAFAQASCPPGEHWDPNANGGSCMPDDSSLSTTPQQTFQSHETQSAQTVPGANSATQVTDEKYETTMKKQGGIYYIVGYIVGKILEFMTGLVEWAIRFGNDATQLPIVKNGWSIILSFTNLGFVLAIIIIAFSTILQIQNYAMKKVLWKLIVAALLVNFSLVIAGSLLDASNFVTVMILNKINSGNLASAFGSALQPQSLLPPKDTNSFLSTLWAIFSTSFLLKHLASIIFIIIFTFLAILTLLTVFIMFMVRAANIIFLLMLSPIIWLCWIFPSTHKYWKQWWDKFIRWLVFAPASVFFMYLAIAAMINGPGGGTALDSTNNLTSQAADPNSAVGAFSNSLLLANDFVVHVVNMFIFIVILIGGLFVANSFGIAGGGLGISWAEKAGKGVGRWAGRKGARAGTWATRKAGVEKFAENLQKGEKGIYKAAKYLGGRNLGNALRVGTTQQREKLIKQADEGHKKYSDKELAMRVASMSADERTAALTRLAKNKNLAMVPNAAKYIADEKTQKIFESYGQVAAYGNLEKAFGANTAMLNAKTEEDRKEAAEEFYKKFSKDDWKKEQFNIIFSTKSKLGLADAIHKSLQEAIAHGIAMNNPGDVRKIILNVKPENFITAHSTITRVSSDIRAKGDKDSIDIADQINTALQKTLTKRFEGELFDYDYGAPSPPSPITPTTITPTT